VHVTKDVRIIIEQHPDGFVAYPVGLRGVIVGQGDTREEAIVDVTSAIQFHVETFGTVELADARADIRQLQEFRRGITSGGFSTREMIEDGRRG
jgi:predicted RNase H-like HicB family nuclease